MSATEPISHTKWSRWMASARTSVDVGARATEPLRNAVVRRDPALIVCVAAVVVAATIAWQRLSGTSEIIASEVVMIGSLGLLTLLATLRTELTVTWLVAAGPLLVSALLLPFGGLSLCWLVVLAATWLLAIEPLKTTAKRDAAPAAAGSTRTTADGAITLSRSSVDGGTLIEGAAVATDLKQTLHVPFVPPLEAAPEVELEPDSIDTRVQLEQCTAFGLRIAVRGGGRVTFAAFVPLQHETSPLSDAPLTDAVPAGLIADDIEHDAVRAA